MGLGLERCYEDEAHASLSGDGGGRLGRRKRQSSHCWFYDPLEWIVRGLKVDQ